MPEDAKFPGVVQHRKRSGFPTEHFTCLLIDTFGVFFDMELRHLRYFVAVSEHLNFRQAARSLGIAQPPLSVQIRKLEEELGGPLFTRQNRRVQLTAAGHTLLVDARDILSRAEQATQRLQDEAAGREGSLTLAFTNGALSESLTKRLRKFFRAHRSLRILICAVDSENSERADAVITEFLGSEMPPTAITLETAVPQVAVPPKHRLGDRTEFLPADLIGETVFVSPAKQRSAVERLLVPHLEQLAVRLEATPQSLQHRFWRVSLGLGTCLCTSVDRGSLDARRTSLGGDFPSIVTAVVPNSGSRAGSLPLLIEAIRN